MGEFVAYYSRWRVALIALGAAAFVVAGLWMVGIFGPPPNPHRYPEGFVFAVGWISVVFFGLCGVMALKMLFDTNVQLQIGQAGIRWTRWSDQTIPWSEITDVTTWSYKRQKAIVLHLRNPGRFPGHGLIAMFASANRRLTGGDIAVSLSGTNRSFDEALAAIARFRR